LDQKSRKTHGDHRAFFASIEKKMLGGCQAFFGLAIEKNAW
jgi:hypothetical protein